MTDQLDVEYRNENDNTQYPFADGSSLLTSTGIAFDPGAIIDAIVYPLGAGRGLRLSRVERTTLQVKLVIGDAIQASLAYAIFDPGDPPSSVRLYNTAGGGTTQAGLLVRAPDRIAALQSWPLGNHAFTVGASEFVARCTIPLPGVACGVAGISAGGQVFTGDVWFLGERGVAVTAVDGGIRIDVTGDPLATRSTCGDGSSFNAPRILKAIDVSDPSGPIARLTPDIYNNLLIAVNPVYAADTTLRINTRGQAVVISSVGKPLEA